MSFLSNILGTIARSEIRKDDDSVRLPPPPDDRIPPPIVTGKQ